MVAYQRYIKLRTSVENISNAYAVLLAGVIYFVREAEAMVGNCHSFLTTDKVP